MPMFAGPEVRGIHIHVTSLCDRACVDCCVQVPRKAKEGIAHHSTWDTFELAAKHLKGLPLGVGGGEITIHPEFPRIAREFRAMFATPFFEMATNGYNLIEQGVEVLRNFDRIHITNYAAKSTQAAIKWMEQELPHLLVVQPLDHIPQTAIGGGKPCIRTVWPIYYDGRLYPCCVGVGFDGAESIALDENWRVNIRKAALPCDRCIFSLPAAPLDPKLVKLRWRSPSQR